MKTAYPPFAALIALAAVFATPARADGDPAAGRQLYASRCAACHSVEYNGVGPTHRNLIGRRAGTAAGFSYSKALKDSNVVWDEQSLTRWLTNPEKFIPGQKMFIVVPDAKERADIVAYLQLVSRQQSAAARNPGENK